MVFTEDPFRKARDTGKHPRIDVETIEELRLANQQDISQRRAFLRLATSFMAVGCAIAPFGRTALGQQSEQVFLGIPDDDVSRELFGAYRVEHIDGYTKITMDRVRPGDDSASVLDVSSIRLLLSAEATQKGVPEPIIITNYLDDGPVERDRWSTEASTKQRDVFARILPGLASHSKRPFVLINVSVVGKRPDGTPEAVHLASLQDDLKSNTLGESNSYVDIPEGQFIAPYYRVDIAGITVHDGSLRVFPQGTAIAEIEPQIHRDIGAVVFRSNKSN